MALHAVACWIWLALALAVAPAAAAPPATQSAAEIAATVVSATGDTTLVRSTTVRTPLRTGEPIRAGDRIVTGEDSTVQLRFTDGGLVSVMARTDFAVEEYRLEPERERSFLRLARGMVRAVSGSIGKRNHDDYRLKTPTATIGIRGTEFIANERVCRIDCPADFAPGLAVTVLQGRVAVTSQAGTIEVPQGETAVVGSRSAMPIIQRPDAPAGAPPPPSRSPPEPALPPAPEQPPSAQRSAPAARTALKPRPPEHTTGGAGAGELPALPTRVWERPDPSSRRS